jgi:cation transporter-like permease
MSEWKSPGDGWMSSKNMKPPIAEASTKQKNIFAASIFGFLLLISINAFAAFCATRLLGLDIEYWRCVLLAIVWVVFRTYDKLWIDSLRASVKK